MKTKFKVNLRVFGQLKQIIRREAKNLPILFNQHHQTMNMEKLKVVAEVPVIDGRFASYDEFRERFMKPNLPVLITGLQVMHQWRACKEWVTQSGHPNLDYLSTHFGSSRVQVAECSVREFTDQKRLDMNVAEFISYWKECNVELQKKDSLTSLLYLKDWHFLKDYPEYFPYTTPTFFMDDWLNFYLENYQLHLSKDGVEKDACSSDYRFVYMGPKGTWTPLHADVLRSFSWSANVCGRKLWHLLPPSETHFIYDKHGRNTVYDIYGDVSVEEFPKFQQASWVECRQEAGQILFIPSGWYHQVTNLEDTISINHNWFNGYNLDWVKKLLLADAEETRASIEDIRSISDNFEELCERNLAANSGMNLTDFFVFLRRMLFFFFSFIRNSNMDSKDDELEKEDCCIEPLSTKHMCMNFLSEVLFNIKAIGGVVDFLSSSKVYRPCVNLDDRPAEKKKEDYFIGGEKEECIFSMDSLEHSEYFIFLIDLWIGHSNQESTMECSKLYRMVSLKNERLKKRVFYNLGNKINGTIHLTKNITIENRGKSPQQLARVISTILDHLHENNPSMC